MHTKECAPHELGGLIMLRLNARRVRRLPTTCKCRRQLRRLRWSCADRRRSIAFRL